jgi:hypothetical protein
MKLKLYRLLYTLYIKSRLLFLWSKFYQLLFQRKYKKYKLSPYCDKTKLEDLSYIMRKVSWSKDEFKELGDSISSPHWFQHLLDTVMSGLDQPEGAVDCDDFANWTVNILDRTYPVKMLCISWIDGKKISGHAVAVVYNGQDKYYHLGNWGTKGPFLSFSAIIDSIVPKDKVYVGSYMLNKDLKLKTVCARDDKETIERVFTKAMFGEQ